MSNTTTSIEWDLTDRLAKSLKVAGVGKSEMANHLGVARNTISNYLSGRTNPTVSVLRVWAIRCGVPFEWLRDGIDPVTSPDPDGTTSDLEITESGCIAETRGKVLRFDPTKRLARPTAPDAQPDRRTA